MDAIQATEDASRTKANGLFVLTADFYGDVVAEAKSIARDYYLGERQQQPHPTEGYIDRDITKAVAKVKAKWETDRSTDLAKMTTGITYIENSLVMPSPKTRWVKEAAMDEDSGE